MLINRSALRKQWKKGKALMDDAQNIAKLANINIVGGGTHL